MDENAKDNRIMTATIPKITAIVKSLFVFL